MITFRCTTDLAYVRGVFTHPDVWPFICEDGASEFVPLDHPSVVYVVPECDGEPMGCLMLQSMGSVNVELHTAILPPFRGKPTTEAYRAFLAWLPATFPSVKHLRTWVPSFNRPALIAAKRVGFIERGIEPHAFLKHGTACDLHLFGVTL